MTERLRIRRIFEWLPGSIALLVGGGALVAVFFHALPGRAADGKQQAFSLHHPERSGQEFWPGAPLAHVTEPNFVGSSRCAVCHTDLVDSQGNDMSITAHWRSTMMANAARDPLWQAKVQSEVARNPALKEVIEKKCVSCHMPMAWTQQQAMDQEYPPDAAGVFSGFLKETGRLHKAAMDGVSCSLCHQMQDRDFGKPASFSGNFFIDTTARPPDRPIFGPYRDPVREPMRTSVGFDPVFGPQVHDSAFCATCHTLFTPFVDQHGQVLGEFPEQTAYLEWLSSMYAGQPGERHALGETAGNIRICQDCHMPHSPAGGVIIAKYAPPGTKLREYFGQHYFVGGNVLMLNVLMDYSRKLGVAAATDLLMATRARTIRQLRQDTADIGIPAVTVQDHSLLATVRLDNRAGHKFPTGFPTRQAWIHFLVADKDGNLIFESGKPLADGGIAGNDADHDASSFEPHHELITQADQVQIYESVMRDTDNQVTQTLLRAAGYAKDNRLLPRGFDKTTVGPEIAVHGPAMADRDFVGGSDEVVYRIKLGQAPGPYTVKAELLYSPLSRAFMRDLATDDDLPLVKRFLGFYQRADKTPVTVASAGKIIR